MKMVKFLIIFAVLIAAAAFAVHAGTSQQKKERRDENGHVLAPLWKEYETAKYADKPQAEEKVLSAIKSEAMSRHLPWDFYEAGRLYVESVSNHNWKLWDSLQKSFAVEVESFDEPVVSYAYSRWRNSKDDPMKFVTVNEKLLDSSHNDQFYTIQSLHILCYKDLVIKSLDSDLEFVLWDIATRNAGESSKAAYAMLHNKLGGRYPEAALLEYNHLKPDGYEDFANKYAGRGVSFIALQARLTHRFYDLAERGAGQDEYVALRRECEELLSRMKALQGEEKRIAACCDEAEELVKTLDAESLSSSVEDGVLSVVFKNLSSATVTVSTQSGKEIFRRQFSNPIRSYFVADTVKSDLPAFDDGDYVVKTVSGKNSHECLYHKYTISLASRPDAEAFRIYAADYKTGKPVAEATLVLESSGKELARREAFVFDGFTKIPDDFVKMMSTDKYCEIRCEYRDRDGVLHKSRTESCRDKTSDHGSADFAEAVILCDRTAFKPGETMRFKGVLYHGDRYKDLEPAREGVSVDVVLVNPEGKDVSSKLLKTNEFGSVAGSFALPEGEKNGSYLIELRQGRYTLKSERIVVDDFVLPSYVISFDEDDNLYLAGDSVHFSGRVTSFSGHPLTSASAEVSVKSFKETVLTEAVELSPDGSFDFGFVSDSLQPYSVYSCEVKVSDGTGETIVASTSATVTKWINMSLKLLNVCEGKSELSLEDRDMAAILGSDVAKVCFDVGRRDGMEIQYEVFCEDELLGAGSAVPGEVKEIALPGRSGLYGIKAVAAVVDSSGERIERTSELFFLKVSDSDKSLDAPVENLFRRIEGDDVAFAFGGACGEIWATVELFDSDNRLLLSDKIHLDGRRAEAGSLKILRYAFDPSWGDVVSLRVFYFRNNRAYRFEASYENKRPKKSLPLEFSRFVDEAMPGASCVLAMKTSPEVECVAAVFDKSTEMISGNIWSPVRLWQYGGSIWYSAENGCNRTEVPVRIRGAAMMARPNSAAMDIEINDYVDAVEEVVQEDAIPFQLVETKAAFGGTVDVKVREDFSSTVAFEPFLCSGSDGNVEFSFKAGDKLSTFVVQVFAHDKKFNNEVIRREMKVTLPVKMAVVEPQFLYRGDKYVVKALVSSNSDAPVDGCVELEAFAGASWKGAAPFLSKTREINVPVSGSVPVECEIQVPSVDTLGIKLTFRSADAGTSDAMFVRIPVMEPVQKLTEAHSALLSPDADRSKLVADLRSMFVNVPGTEASVTEMSMMDMVKDAIPQLVRTDRRDLVSVCGALYSGLIARSLKENVAVPVSELEQKLLRCRCDCGGFSWFEGMEASPILTALVLERYHALSRKGLAGDVPALGAMVRDAVKYLDKSYFADDSMPWWRGALSIQQYLHVRSLYPEVTFDSSAVKPKALKEFRKDAKAYLLPRKVRGLNGDTLLKARRCLTLSHLSDEGSKLLDSWGISLGKLPQIRKSCYADVESLLEYAVPHKCGGYYYPNAVMPWRGLMESELYAHVVLCELFDGVPGFGSDAVKSIQCRKVAEGIRLWMMVQKETQKWGDDPAFVDALAAVLDANEETLATKVVVLKADFAKPFGEVAASGNGFVVSRTYKRDGVLLEDGDTLRVGEKIVAEYSIKNDENRSFVMLSCPRPASLRPVQQLSGRIGWWLGVQGYRNVLSDRSEYWYDSYPEENSVVREEFHVTQKGEFHVPAVSVESLYAPHYRANDDGCGPLISE